MNYRFLLLLFFFGKQTVFSQGVVDLIEKTRTQLNAASTTEEKSKFTADLAWYYSHVNLDSALVYGNKSLQYSKLTNNDTLIGQSLNDLSTVHYVRGDYPKSIDFAKKSLTYRTKLSDTAGIASLYNKLGNNYNKTSVLDSTIYYYVKSRDFYLKQKDTLNAITIASNIASTYFTSGNFNKALEYLNVSIDYFKKNDLKQGLSNAYVTLGNITLAQKDTINAIKHLKQAETFAAASKNYIGLAAALNNLSTIYNGLNDVEKSTQYIKRAIAIREERGLLGDLESAKLTLAINNFTLGKINASKKGLYAVKPFFTKVNAYDKLQNVYETLMLIYSFERNTDSLKLYSRLYKETLNKNISQQNLKFSQEIEAKYETAQKQKEIIAQRADIAEKQLNINKKNSQLIGLGLVAILLSVLGYLIYNQQKLKNKQLQKEAELKEAIARIETQNKLQEQRLRISRDLHDNIGAQLTFVISSIENLQYGFKIKNEKLTDKLKGISTFTKDTIYELRDTIWAMNKSEISIEDLEVRISNFVKKANEYSTDVSFKFSIDESVSKATVFTSVKGMNIYRIIQEAINNALKYAEANHINVNLEQQGNKFIVQILDDGKGFDVTKTSEGNGLNNMKKRAKEINAKISIDSNLGKGTTIELVT